MACPQKRSPRLTIRDLGSMVMSTPQQPRPSPATWFVEDDDCGGVSSSSGDHFLDECRMCGRHLQKNRDIYMYRGDTPFCSEDCRDEQIWIDEQHERANHRRRRAEKAATASSQVKPPNSTVTVGAV